MTVRKFTDRSRIITTQRCPRQRFLNYHEAGAGIQSLKTPLPLAVGGSVHEGLAILLRFCLGRSLEQLRMVPEDDWRMLEDEAVKVALIDFAQFVDELEVDANERASIVPNDNIGEMLAQSLGLAEDDPQVLVLVEQNRSRVTDFDKYLRAEQGALVEGMVRAWSRRKLRGLWEQFEVLEVEREGMWQLSEAHGTDDKGIGFWGRPEIWFMSRPDALLLERYSGQLYLQSFKTTGSWDIRKGKDAEHDMQGLSEGVEVEKRLGEWWDLVTGHPQPWKDVLDKVMPRAMFEYLANCSAPPRIYAIRYEYLLKGDRRRDRDLSIRLGVEARSQSSHLVRGYFNYKTSQWNWSWDFKKDDGSAGKLAYQSWTGKPIWEAMTIARWIDMLDTASETMSGEDASVGLEPRVLGYGSLAQASGYTDQHPLDAVFMTPIIVYRNDDDLRDWIDQTEAGEVRVQEGLAQIEAVSNTSERRHLLNVYFPMARHSCEYPSTCQFVPICYGGEDIKFYPLGSGKFRARVPNHPQEVEK